MTSEARRYFAEDFTSIGEHERLGVLADNYDPGHAARHRAPSRTRAPARDAGEGHAPVRPPRRRVHRHAGGGGCRSVRSPEPRLRRVHRDVVRGGDSKALEYALPVVPMRSTLVKGGHTTADALDEWFACLADPDFWFVANNVIAAWGVRPL